MRQIQMYTFLCNCLFLGKNMILVAQYDESAITNANTKGFELCRVGRITECVEQYSNSLKIYSNQSTVYFHLGAALRSLNRLQESVSAYETSVQLAESAGDTKVIKIARFQIGMAKIDLGQWDAAIAEFDRILSIDRKAIFPEALYRMTYLQHFACNFTRRENLLRDVKETVSWELSAGTSSMTPSQALMLLDSPQLYHLSRMYADGHLLAALEGQSRPWFWNLADFLDLTGLSVSSYGA
jgi:tetratricopeptide (TPR) repeat protein